jgi:hypothetical protein
VAEGASSGRRAQVYTRGKGRDESREERCENMGGSVDKKRQKYRWVKRQSRVRAESESGVQSS